MLTFHGSFNKKKDKKNILLLLPKTRGPFGVSEFKGLLKNKFNLLEYNDVLSEKSNIFNQSEVITFEQKALAINSFLKKWKNIKFHVVGHSTGCGLGTFIAKQNKVDCESLTLINPWNKQDNEFRILQTKRVENAKKFNQIRYLKSDYKLLYSKDYTLKFKKEFSELILKQKNNNIDASLIKRRLQSILDCNIGDELCKLVLPKLIINAVDDKLMKIHHGEELHKLCYNSKLISLNSGGHMLTETRAKDLNTHISNFMGSFRK